MTRSQLCRLAIASMGMLGFLWIRVASVTGTGMPNALAEDLPLIEPHPNPNIKAPAGYRAYIYRDSKRVVVARAERVYVADDDLHAPDQIIFDYGTGGILKSRRPKKPGEVSRVFLPKSFDLPDNVRALRAVTPASTPSQPLPPRITKFDEEPPPPSLPPGTRAYRGEFRGVVYTGTVTGIIGTPDKGFVFAPGSNVKVRVVRKTDTNKTSHIIVPPGVSLPPDFIASSLRN